MTTLLLMSALVFGFGLISHRLYKSAITPPMAFVVAGLLAASGLFGELGDYDGFELTRVLAELTLVLVLFTDASRILFRELKDGFHLPLRLLSIGMPLTILLGGVLAWWMFPDFGFWPAFVLAAVLAPTDAALGQAVVSSEKVPSRIRQALNVESGLNDGLALPLVLVLAALANMADEPLSGWALFAAVQVTLGPIVGIAVGYFGGQLVTWCVARHWMAHSYQQLSALALAFLAFLISEEVGGNGFIAAFAAGLTLGNTAPKVREVLQDFAETEGQLASLLTFLCFGAHLAWPLLTSVTAESVIYAILSLTLVRMLPVSLSLVGTGLKPFSHLFLGWFGPRGLASILFAFLVVEEGVPGRDTILVIVVVTVLISVFAHGVTAWPASSLYADFCDKRKAEAKEEWMPVHELPTRLSSGRTVKDA